MRQLVQTRSRLVLWLLCALLISVLPLVVSAQDTAATPSGTTTVGTIAADAQPVSYNFEGALGDIVTVQVIGITPGMDPNVTLLGPAQETLLSVDNTPFALNNMASTLVYRLNATGTYTIAVGGTPGDFVLMISLLPAVQITTLELDTPVQVTLPLTTPSQVFAFNTDPFNPTTLHIDADPFNLNAMVEVRNAIGQTVARFHGDLDNACVSLAPGDALHDVVIQGDPALTGTLTLTLSHAPCALGQPPAEPVAVVPPQFTPVPLEGVCAASSYNNVNVRLGPGLVYPVNTLLLAYQPVQVVGVSQDGLWYSVTTPTVTGWVAASVVAVVGPCDQLQVVVVEVQPPAATPTPGLPAVTPAPDTDDDDDDEATESPVEETPEATQPTGEVTETPQMTPTVETTEAVEVTPTVAPAEQTPESTAGVVIPERQVLVCIPSGDAAAPYAPVPALLTDLAQFAAQPGIYYAPVEEGCPTQLVETAGGGQINICHSTGAGAYNLLSISVQAVIQEGHGDHAEDLIPAPMAGCPAA